MEREGEAGKGAISLNWRTLVWEDGGGPLSQVALVDWGGGSVLVDSHGTPHREAWAELAPAVCVQPEDCDS